MRAYFEIIRPLNVLIAFISVFLVLFLVHAEDPWPIFWAAAGASMICAGSNIINDYFDIEIDRVNRPDRVLVRGAMTKSEAIIFWATLSGLGVLCNVFLNKICLSISIFAVAGLFIYSWKLKKTAVWGNFVVSFFAALAFIYGGLAVGKINETLVPAMFAFLFHFGREILKDIEDMHGDQKNDAKTLPIQYGTRLALSISTLCFVFLIMLMLFASLFGIYGMAFGITIGVTMLPILVWTIYSMWKDSSSKNLRTLNHLLKAAMFAGLLAIYLG